MYKIENIINKIYCEDCLKFMQDIPDKSINMVFTSPPYNMCKKYGINSSSPLFHKYKKNYNDNMVESEYIEWQTKVIAECLRVSNYTFYVMMLMPATKRCIISLMNTYQNNLKDVHFYEKHAPCNVNNGVCAKGVEWILCFGQDGHFKFTYNNFPQNNYVKNVNTFNVKEKIPEHHATFPLALAKHYIGYYSRENDVVFDPFMGSGTTAVASIELKRRFIGSEISPEYCRIAEKRIKTIKGTLKFDF